MKKFLGFVILGITSAALAQPNPVPGPVYSLPGVNNQVSIYTLSQQGTPIIQPDKNLIDDGNSLRYKGVSLSGTPSIVSSGLVAEYLYNEGSGSVLTDYSGNKNNGTLASGSNAPTWSSAGLSFVESSKQYVSLPASLNSAHTFQFFMYTQCVTLATVNNFVNPLAFFGSNVTNLGNNFWLGNNNATISVPDGAGSEPSTGKNNTTTDTISQQTACGLHLLTFVLGTSNDQIYIDGQQVTYLSTTGTYGAQTAAGGNFQIGTTVQFTGNTYSFNGSILFTAIYSSALTAGQVASNYQAISSYSYATKDLSSYLPPSPNYSSSTSLVTDGDSLTYGLHGTPYIGLLSLNQTWTTKTNTGIPSIVPQGNFSLAPINVDPFYARAASQNADLIWTGTNGSTTSTFVNANYQWIVGYCQARRQQGWKVFVLTMISRTGQDSGKNLLNALLRQNWPQFADGLVDVAANPNIGADGASANGTYFFTDGIHLLTAGDTIVAGIASNAVNAYYGNTVVSPTATTSTAYVETAADNFVVQTPGSAATLTLVDCLGLTGTVRSVTNGSATNAITVSGANSETITGSATVAANASAKFLDVLTGPTTGGCFWQRIQ